MAYVSLYRKWRPQVFSDVVGQAPVVRTLTNALESGRVGHAYLFAGPRGSGKTSVARLLAKGLNCEHGPTGNPCGKCTQCQRIAAGHSVDVLEIDGASNRGIDEIREIRERVKYAPAEGTYKVYIIDEVHMLTTEAFNALLKVLEEPPSHVVFIFATTESHRIPATILSRCQNFHFRPHGAAEIVAHLKTVADGEGVAVDEEALALIARHADGGLRDALGYLDQCIAFAEDAVDEAVATQVLGATPREWLEQLADALVDRHIGRCLLVVKECVESGGDVRQLAANAARFFRDLMLLSVAPQAGETMSMTDEMREKAAQWAEAFGPDRLLAVVEALGRAESEMRFATVPGLPLELALIELTRGSDPLDGLAKRIAALEEKLSHGAAVSPSRPVPEKRAPAPERPAARQSGASKPAQRPAAEDKTVDPPQATDDLPGSAHDDRPIEEHQEAPVGGANDPELLARVHGVWDQLLADLRAGRAMQQAAFLMEGRPGAAQANVVTIYFSPNHRFHQANIDQEANRAVVESALGKLLGTDIQIATAIGTPPPPPPEGGALQSAPEPGPTAPSPSESDNPRGRDEPELPPEGDRSASEGGRGGDGPGEQRAQGDDSPDDAADPMDEPIIKAALDMFGGTITKIERKDVQS